MKLAEEGARNEWIEAELPSQVSLTQEQEDLIKEQALQLPNISEVVTLVHIQCALTTGQFF